MIKYNQFSLKIKLSSNNIQDLLKYSCLLKDQLLSFSIKFSSIGLPKLKRKFTLLKSPHVHKKSKEHFALHSYSIVFFVACPSNWLNNLNFNFLQNSIKISITSI